MFYVNNKQVLGIFLNGNNYNYMSFGFGKIIPENRSAQFAYINLAQRYLSQYRVEYGNIQSGYDNFPIARLDYPVNGVFHSPLTYYYGGNIVPTKNVPVYINNGYSAIRGTVYNDINVNGNIVYFAANTDFQGHNVNIHPENFRSTSPYFNGTVMDNCSNFRLRAASRFSKSYPVTLYACNNFSGQFNFFNDDDGTRYPGFRGFLQTCRDGVFSFNLINMHGGGDGTYNFSCISNSNNISLTINGSPWQAWVHPNCYSSNCNINTYNVISGFSYVNDCNFNVVLPKDSKPEMDKGFEFLNNAENCNYNLNALDSNLFNYRSGVGHVAFFDNLNNCNLNLLVNNTVSFSHSFSNNLHNCNIVFDNIKADLSTFAGWYDLYNCNISGNVESMIFSQGFIEHGDGINVNINAAKSSNILAMWKCNNTNGKLVCGDMAYISRSFNQNLWVYRGRLCLDNISHSYFRVNNTTFNCRGIKDTEIYSYGGNTAITGADNCHNLKLSGLTFHTTALGDSCLLENVYNSNIKFGTANPYYRLWRVESCTIDGFPRGFAYVKNCVFYPFTMRDVGLSNSEVGTRNNAWSHNRIAGIRSMDNISNCRIYANVWASNGSITFEGSNNMQTSFGSYYNGTVTANLPGYNLDIKLNVDCNTLNLGIFQAGPPHGFRNATISANTIYATGKGAGGSTYVQVNCDTKIYCENYCNVPFYSDVRSENSVLQPVVLINNYQHSNSIACRFCGGLTRIGRLSFQGGAPAGLSLETGACVFINNALLGRTVVKQNSLLFLGSNITWANGITVESGGLVVNKENWGSHASEVWSRVSRDQLAWNVWDSGPWGPFSLFDFCINV